MKVFYIFMLSLICSFRLLSQSIGIGTTNPQPSAKLDISATDKGFLPASKIWSVDLSSETLGHAKRPGCSAFDLVEGASSEMAQSHLICQGWIDL